MMNRQDSRRRAERAFQLRSVGRTWQEIADTLGYKGRQSAQEAVARHLRQTPPESPAAARRSASEGLRITLSTLFASMADAKQQGDTSAVVSTARAIADTIDKSAKLNGLHVPVAQQVDVNVSTSAAAILDRAEAELLALAAATTQPPQRHLAVIDAEVMEA